MPANRRQTASLRPFWCHWMRDCPAQGGPWISPAAPGGMLFYVQPTRKNLERHASPSERFLLEDGALPGLVWGLEILHYEEGWSNEGRHEARLLAQRPVAPRRKTPAC